MIRLVQSPKLTGLRHAVLFAVVLFSFLTLTLLAAQPVFAQVTDSTAFNNFAEASTLSQESIGVLIARVIRVALSVIGIIFVSIIIYAGYLWFTAAGRPEPVVKAKKVLQQSIIGLILILLSYAITTFILNALLDAAYEGSSSATADAYTEPLSGSLGGGILDDHYPPRNATDIPRNTKIFVTFKEAIDLASMISGYDEDDTSTALNIDSVLIYPTDEGASAALGASEVSVSYTDDYEIFVFDPVEYLGSSEEDTNYTVVLTTNIETADGDPAFSGTYSSGYEWTFEVSTEIDLTPPTVTFTIPQQDADEPRNVSIELTFSEAMDPVAATGTYYDTDASYYTNIEVVDSAGANVEGTFEISNAYKTVSFTTYDACGEDPCGDTIYCLPGDDALTVTAKAASIDADEVPQSLFAIADGLTDAAANSLDGDDDGDACGSSTDAVACKDEGENDDHVYAFTTTDEIEDTVPEITSLNADIGEDNISQTDAVTATFNTYLKGSTLDTNSVSIWPDPNYEMWFSVRKSNTVTDSTPAGCGLSLESSCVSIEHPTFVANAEGGWNYYPVFTNEIKSVYQICMYPAMGPNSCDGTGSGEYCCNGSPSTEACTTESGDELPDNTSS
ncbi:hypothetical protein CO174_05440 [Candidatus Uhrbacteria bacterium CG_4_9_14_3_um_filter_50_9]|uniref:SbsA Ig-like domain-containing protein n=1 Tax=Candidatus Uhrbacteria bacterium CG_4_9_14_3_um_filter_50_9 TaxID=1975035 RepID=A0A2M7XAY7_9BACT|nr:MAG: hypothetical protein CO174_05440 [Candidatus Uhrbacteria bacterium CG_4_9_14_3_um_filter_50_9]